MVLRGGVYHQGMSKRVHRVAFALWVCPGLPVSIYLRDSVAWVMVLSVYTILAEHFIGMRQEEEQEAS